MSQIVTARRPKRKPVRAPKPKPIARIVYSPSAKTLAAIRRWEWLTGRIPSKCPMQRQSGHQIMLRRM